MTTMRTAVPGLLLFLLAFTGCGHVAGNYPMRGPSGPKPLPETFQIRGNSLTRVWEDPERIHAFLFRQKMAQDMVDRMEYAETKGNPVAGRDARIFKPLARAGYAYAHLRILVARGVDVKLRKGDLLITFSDGTTVPDNGALLYPQMGNTNPPDSSVDGTIDLRGVDDRDMDSRGLFVFFPGEMLEKKIIKVEWGPEAS